MQKARIRIILLSRIITRKMLRKLWKDDPSLKKIFHLPPSEISQYFTISQKQANYIHENLRNKTIIHTIKRDQMSSTIITPLDPEYPTELLHTHDPPFVLYCLGDISLLNKKPMISVIGTRKPSNEARRKLNHIVRPLIENNWIIVSGLAYGIDSLAHQLTLQQQGKTISVLGSGFGHIYPKENEYLFQQIIQSGLVITEYPPDQRPRRFHFPERNRIISGLSMATLVIEATEKSGTLITVDQALDQGKEVYAVPGSPWVPQTIGCHKMIQDGAKLVISANDIIEDFSEFQKEVFNHEGS